MKRAALFKDLYVQERLGQVINKGCPQGPQKDIWKGHLEGNSDKMGTHLYKGSNDP